MNNFKVQVKIKYKATKAVARKFPNGTAVLMELLSRAQPVALDWAGYCTLTPDQQLMCEKKSRWTESVTTLPNEPEE